MSEKLYTEEQYEKAKNLIGYRQHASVMMLVYAVTKKYTPAAQIMYRLEDEGLVGPHRGDKPRRVFVKPNASNDFGAYI